MRFPGFWRASFSAPKPNAEAVARVKDWARATLQAAPDTAFAVNEIACNDPACPGLETVILVMEPGKKTRALKVSKALEAVTEEDLRGAL
jgi:hypothetical protein